MTVLTVLFLLAVLQGASQAGSGPVQESAAAIRGRVTDKDSGFPISRALVRIARAGESSARYARTDDDGQYEFTGLPPGEYSGFVDSGEHRATHLVQSLEDPATRRRVLRLKAGEVRDGVNVALSRAVALNVRVIDEWGGPLSGVEIKVTAAGSGRRGWRGRPRETDDQGRVRLFGLSPDRYHVCAEPRGYGGFGEGRSPARERFLRTCHPSAAGETQPEPVSLEQTDGEDVTIVMRRGRTFRISGTVVDATGTPASGARVSLERFEQGSSSAAVSFSGADGRFTISNVPPGDYAITAEIGGDRMPEHRGAHEAAYYPILLRADSSDVDGLVVDMTRTVDLRGRISPEDPGEALPASFGSGLMIVSRLAEDPVAGSGSGHGARAAPDRTFVLEGIFGPRLLDVYNVPRGWYVKAIQYDGRNIVDEATTFRGAAPKVEIVLSSRGAVVTGDVVDSRGEPASGARVVLLASRAEQWALREFSSAAVSSTGEFRVGPVRGGEYLILAVPPATEMPAPWDRASIARLAARAARISLRDDEERLVDLRVAR